MFRGAIMKLLRLTKTMLSCVAALSTLLTLYATLYRHPVQVVNHWHATDPAPLTDEYCARHPDPGNIVITVKTGATEAFQKLPSQLVTSLRCSKKLLVFSDLEQRLGSHRLHDALSNFSSKAMEKNEDFDIYRLQQRYAARGFETEINELKSIKDPRPSWRTAGHNAAWALDKYKFLHIVEKAWELAPDQDFYVFIEADTYLVWSNLLRYLATLDASQPLYLGKPVHMREHPRPGPPFYFGYGGSGLILSGATMRKFAVVKQGLASRWDNRIKDMWFGDYLLAAALEEELAITLTDASPMLNADKPAALPFGPTLWCQPVMTLHHMSVTDTQSIWEVEKTLGDVCMTFADVHSLTYADRGFAFKKSSWDNLSYDKSSALEAVPTGASTLVGLFVSVNDQSSCETLLIITFVIRRSQRTPRIQTPPSKPAS